MSVLSQDVSSLEYVVMDGGSMDETTDIIKRYESRLRWVSEKDNGQAHAVNKGIRATKGQIIGWLNSDDIYYPEALKTVIQYFDSHPEVQIAYGDADHIDEYDNVIEPYPTEDWNYARLREICFLCQPAVFFRREIIEKYGMLDEKLNYCMDYEYWLRVGSEIPFIHIKRKLAGSRMYKENKTLGARIAVHKEINDMMKEKYGLVPKKWIYGYAHTVVDQIGYDRNINLQNLIYTLSLIGISLRSFIHWNNWVPRADLMIMGKWLMASCLAFLRS